MRSYRSDRWSFSGSLQTSDKAEAVLRRLAPGRSVKVHHDPSDPTIAVLTPGGGRFGWGLLGFGGLFIALGLLVGLSRRRTRRTEAEISG